MLSGMTGTAFRDSLLATPALERDAWLDSALGIGDVPDDGPELPRGCVPYLPCPVDALLRVIEHGPVGSDDVFVDLGSGVGRAVMLTHLLTGAAAIGIEIQPQLVAVHRAIEKRLGLTRCPVIAGDAAELVGSIAMGSVFFLYCPFSGARLAAVLDALLPMARTRRIRICCVNLELPARPWLQRVPLPFNDLAIYASAL
jgi:hypothetical protein